ncbi:hypothetical protein NUW54_g5982 [Trametes sanguinea]|uniref:Uncharacterized protein n=1 Tax=Trametes sanguinea TaxID=158606 RepID=A0ACC1PTM1_9APHY|nr:hypothetical protein NUW54_g5982 [Trametes sanguinea]
MFRRLRRTLGHSEVWPLNKATFGARHRIYQVSAIRPQRQTTCLPLPPIHSLVLSLCSRSLIALSRRARMAFMDDLASVMANASATDLNPPPATPVPSASRKRVASDDDPGSDSDDDVNPSSPVPLSTPRGVNQNLIVVAKRVGGQKKLKAEQLRELEDFASDTLAVHNIKLFAKMLALETRFDKLASSAPPFEVSPALKRNILSYCTAVFFSSKLAAYKGHIPRNHVLDIIKRLRFDIPTGLEGHPAEWGKVQTCVQDTLTQIRGAVKKLLSKSVVSTTDTKLNMSIYDLAVKVVRNTTLKVSIPLMARLALMRGVFMESSDENFWDHVDDHLNRLRSLAKTPEALIYAFKHALKKDRETHGLGPGTDYDVDSGEALADNPLDEVQQNADDAIEEANRRAAIAAQATAAASRTVQATPQRPEREEDHDASPVSS